ncbi:MAG: glycosyl transferase [Methylobacterium sp.]|nr:MAG: glycosyl transferase [Methylobacterium sp.]
MNTSVSVRLPGSAPVVSAERESNARAPFPVLLCLSHLRWDFVFQRPQHLLTRAAEAWHVLFFEEPVFSADRTVPELRRRLVLPNIEVLTPLLPEGLSPMAIVEAQRQLLDARLAEERGEPDIVWYYTPMALPISRHIACGLRVYDCMDELSGFLGAPPALVALEQELMQEADVVFTGGLSLFEAKRGRHGNIHAFPSSIDSGHFGQARRDDVPEPADLAEIPHPRLVYFGVIDERLDLALLDELARLRPDWSVLMIGPVVKIDPNGLPNRPNMHWLGMKPYTELPAYLAHASAGIMPFAINAATRFISPTKTPEFLAAGLPVVSTPVRDVVRSYGEAGLVAIAPDAEGFVASLEQWLEGPPANWLARVDAALAQGSWNETWHRMSTILHATAARKHPLAPRLVAGTGTAPTASRPEPL